MKSKEPVEISISEVKSLLEEIKKRRQKKKYGEL